ncbi:MAG: hypothetical protein K9N10_02405 [Deltaproteobacteria bacterium]|nr:hypothetical protein [Deltaproteobacteria bacterium]
MDLKIRSWSYRIFNAKAEVLWVLVGQTGNALGILLGMKILTQFLNPFEFGRLSIANTVVLLISVSVFGPLGHGFMRFWSISHDRGRMEDFFFITDRYAGWLFLMVLLGSLVFALICSATTWHGYQSLMAVALVVGASRGYFGLKLAILLGARRRKIVALMNSGTAILKPLTAALAVVLFSPSADWAIWGYLIATWAILLVVGHHYKDFVKEDLKNSLVGSGSTVGSHKMGKEILAFSWPFCAWGIFVWIHQSCDRWSLLAFHSADVVGAFSVVALLAAYPLMFASGFMLNLFMPVAYARAGDLSSPAALKSAYRLILMMIALYGLGSLGLILFFALFHETVVLLMSRSEYVRFSHLLPTLTLSWAFFYLGESLAAIGFVAKKPKIYILPKVISAIMAALGSLYFSFEMGARGVVWALGISGIFYAAWCAIIAYGLFIKMPVHSPNSDPLKQAL